MKQEVKGLFLFTTIELSQVRGREKRKKVCITLEQGDAFLAMPWIASKFREVWGV